MMKSCSTAVRGFSISNPIRSRAASTTLRSLVGPLGCESSHNRKGWSGVRCCAFSSDEIAAVDSSNGSLPSASFRTVDAEITQETSDFFVSDAEGDPDRPSDGFSSIDAALEALRSGKIVIVVDEEKGDEGDLVMAASVVSTKSAAFMLRHGSGIIYVGMKEEDLNRLQLPMMTPPSDIEEISVTDSAMTVDARAGKTGGVSAADRATTIRALSSRSSKPSDFRRPGHVFPVKYRRGGVLHRAGHVEASVDLVSLAGLSPVSALTTIMEPDDGSVANLATMRRMAGDHALPIISITDLIRYRRKREKVVERVVVSRLPTAWGVFKAYCYRSKLDGMEHVAIVKV